MADSQVKTANICNITSSTELRGNGGGTGTFLTNNSVKVYCNGSAYWSGVYFTSGSESLITGDKYTISFTPYCANNNTIRVQFCGVADNYTFTSGIRKTITVTAVDTIRTVAFYAGDAVEKTILIKDIQIEKGETATPYRPYSATGWLHSLRKLGTATDTFTTLPADIYVDGNNATVGLKGNTVQNGTPTPSNPVEVNGVGVRTANLFDYETMKGGKTGHYLDASGNEIQNNFWSITKYIPVDGTVFTLARTFGGTSPAICLYDSNKNFITGVSYQGEQVVTISSNTNAAYIRFSYFIGEPLEDIAHDMLNTGSIPLPYEPYGYKIPISSAQGTAVNYLGSVQSYREISKRVYDGTENWALHGGLSNVFWINDYQDGYSDNTETGFAISNAFTQRPYNNVASLSNGQFVYGIPSGTVTKRILMKNTNCATKEDWIAYLQAQYANGTPVTVWYVLATPTTATVNEPLMKIGDYADSISNAVSIPTTEGANSISVDTTVQPSEFTATWTGWHDATVKEWDGSDWN